MYHTLIAPCSRSSSRSANASWRRREPRRTATSRSWCPPVPETPAFQVLVKRAFATRRKTLRNAWRGLDDDLEGAAREASVSLDARGETLDVDAFARMAALVSRPTSPRGP